MKNFQRNLKYIDFSVPRKTPGGWILTVLILSALSMLTLVVATDTGNFNYLVGCLFGFFVVATLFQFIKGPDEYSDVKDCYYVTNSSQTARMLDTPMTLAQVRWHVQGIRGNFFSYISVKDWDLKEQRRIASNGFEYFNFLTQNSTRSAWYITMLWGVFFAGINLFVVLVGDWSPVNWLNVAIVVLYVAIMRYKLMNIPPKSVDTPQEVA